MNTDIKKYPIAGLSQTMLMAVESSSAHISADKLNLKKKLKMKKIKELMNEQINYMFVHCGERSSVISNQLSEAIDEYCGGDLDSDGCLDKLAEVQEVWKDLMLTRYNFAVNQIFYGLTNKKTIMKEKKVKVVKELQCERLDAINNVLRRMVNRRADNAKKKRVTDAKVLETFAKANEYLNEWLNR